MTIDDDRPTTAERYGRATHASRLRLDPERRGDADTLIAAGLVPDFFGMDLMRFREELETGLSRFPQLGPLRLIDRNLISSALPSLAGVLRSLGAWGEVYSARHSLDLRPGAIASLSGRALIAYVRPLCRSCEGRGFNGGGRTIEQSGPQILCRACRGSRQESYSIGRTVEERFLVSGMLTHMEKSETNAAAGIRRNRALVDAAKASIEEGAKRG